MTFRPLSPLFFLGFALLGAGSGNTCIAQQTGKAKIYSELQRGDYGPAEQDARRELASAPDDCTLRVMLGMALEGQDRIADSMTTLQAEIDRCPRFVPGLEKAAEIAYKHKLPVAEPLLRKLLEVAPTKTTGRAMLATIEARDGHCEDAVRDYGLAGDAVLQNGAAVYQEAECLHALKQFGGEDRLLSVRLAAAGTDAVAGRQLAALRFQQGDAQGALTVLGPWLGEGSTDDRALLLAAQIAESENRTPEAIVWLRRAIAADPRRIENYVYFADVSFRHGSSQVGVDVLNLGLTQNPDNARLLVARGVLEVQLSQMDAALRDFTAAHRHDPTFTFADDALGMLLSQGHDLAAATKAFAELLKTQPNDPLLHYLYAESLSQDGQDTQSRGEAIAQAREAVRLEPGYGPAHDLLCTLLMRAGDVQGVLRESQAALELDADDEVALYQELLAQRRLQNQAEVAVLTARLETAREHNRRTVTKYVLREDGAPE